LNERFANAALSRYNQQEESDPMDLHRRIRKTVGLLGSITALLLAGTAADYAQAPALTANSARAAAVFDRVKNDQSRLRIFLQAMPKGANLHNHLDGSVYTETYVRLAAEHSFCADFSAAKITPPPCRTPGDELKDMGMRDPGRYETFMNLISRRTYRKGLGYDVPGGSTGGGGFPAIYAISVVVPSESMVLSRRLAANDNDTYTEFIYQPDILDKTASAVNDTEWNPKDMESAYNRALPTLKPVVQQAIADFETYKAQADKVLGCNVPNAAPVCNLAVRFLTYARRGDRQDQVFQAIMMAFMLANADPNYVGFNIVGPESKESAVADYDLNMEMIHFVGSRFPHVHRSLHAGEQTMGKASPEALLDHEKKAIEIGGAERIGHGTSIAFETDAVSTLARMAHDNIAVEINLTSNDRFGAFGSYHPLNLYRAAGVPVTIATDNTGMARVDLSNEYVRAAYEHKLDYKDLKYVARTGMQVTFLPGQSLWDKLRIGVPVEACKRDELGSDDPSPACKRFLSNSAKAELQWRYEKQLAKFEHDVQGWRF
jgi:adenosine deaminase